MEGSRSGSGAGSIPLTDGSGSRRSKNMWIRWIQIRIWIRIHNTGRANTIGCRTRRIGYRVNRIGCKMGSISYRKGRKIVE
jgi:hypothetical protein